MYFEMHITDLIREVRDENTDLNQLVTRLKLKNIKRAQILSSCSNGMLIEIFMTKRFDPKRLSKVAVEEDDVEMCKILIDDYNYYHVLELACETDIELVDKILSKCQIPREWIDMLTNKYYHDQSFDVLESLIGYDKQVMERLNINASELLADICDVEGYEVTDGCIIKSFPNIHSMIK